MRLMLYEKMYKLKPYIALFKSLFVSKSKDLSVAIERLKQADERHLLNTDTLSMIKGIFNVSEMHVRAVMVPRSKMIFISYKSNLEEIMDTVISSAFAFSGDRRRSR